jgi:hypothetical protein
VATVNLRLRGVTPLHFVSAAVSAAPIVYSGVMLARHAPVAPVLVALSVVVAALPWLSRAAARAAYRAKCDEIAVHVRGEALPYKTITEVRVERSARRHLLRLIRGETTELVLVLWDAFAGRLEPIDELARRLEAAGRPIPRP